VSELDADTPDLDLILLIELGRSPLTGQWHVTITTQHGICFYSAPCDSESEAMEVKEHTLKNIRRNFLNGIEGPFRVN
jgi:hypothetical protein